MTWSGSQDSLISGRRRASRSNWPQEADTGSKLSLEGVPKRERPRLLNPCMWLAGLTLLTVSLILYTALASRPAQEINEVELHKQDQGGVLISYSYFEKDPVQRENAAFFLELGMGVQSTFKAPRGADLVFIVNGDLCSPCAALQGLLSATEVPKQMQATVSEAKSGGGITLLQRIENAGMDFAAHNVTLEWLRHRERQTRCKYFIFLNSSVRGPFYPSYMPVGWQWTDAYTERLQGRVHGVSSSIVCLPEVDAGGYGPKMESWAFALSNEGLQAAVKRGVFWKRECKLCTGETGIVVQGEYGLTKALLDAKFNIATLMSRYARDLDWSLEEHWDCNNNVHPSRHGTYDNIAMHPFEVLFLKASWDVGQPHLERYTEWFRLHAKGIAGTRGAFDEPLYRYAISAEAQEPNHAADCFTVPREAIE